MYGSAQSLDCAAGTEAGLSDRRLRHPISGVLRCSADFLDQPNPLALADEAFLRRLGYKVRFEVLTAEEYESIWRQVCKKHAIAFDATAFRYVLELYRREDRPLLPCQPRDLLGLVMDQCRYQGLANQVTDERLACAWNSYFVRPVSDPEPLAHGKPDTLHPASNPLVINKENRIC